MTCHVGKRIHGYTAYVLRTRLAAKCVSTVNSSAWRHEPVRSHDLAGVHVQDSGFVTLPSARQLDAAPTGHVADVVHEYYLLGRARRTPCRSQYFQRELNLLSTREFMRSSSISRRTATGKAVI